MTPDPDASGWWQASDGKWYPPETRPVQPATPPSPPPASPPSIAQPSIAQPSIAQPSMAQPSMAPPVAPPPVPPTGPPSAAPPGPVKPPAPPPVKVTYDADGWITIDEPVVVAPPPPPAGNRMLTVVAVVVALVVVGAAAVVFIPRGSHRPAESVASTGDDASSDGVDAVDPLTRDATLSTINIRFSDVGDGYQKVLDGAIDPVGGDGCAQPRRPFVNVAGTNWVAYLYQPAGLGGRVAGHIAAAVTVFDHTPDANKRLQSERGADYAQCLQRWDRGVWTESTTFPMAQDRIDAMPVRVPGATAFSYRYTGSIDVDGVMVPAYTDHIVFTKGRVRVWIEVSSLTGPFDQGRRDLLVSRLSARLDAALA